MAEHRPDTCAAAKTRRGQLSETKVFDCQRALRYCCGFVLAPFPAHFSSGLRGCLDRLTTSKQTAATGRSIAAGHGAGAIDEA